MAAKERRELRDFSKGLPSRLKTMRHMMRDTYLLLFDANTFL